MSAALSTCNTIARFTQGRRGDWGWLQHFLHFVTLRLIDRQAKLVYIYINSYPSLNYPLHVKMTTYCI